jgi:hypothetical protein
MAFGGGNATFKPNDQNFAQNTWNCSISVRYAPSTSRGRETREGNQALSKQRPQNHVEPSLIYSLTCGRRDLTNRSFFGPSSLLWNAEKKDRMFQGTMWNPRPKPWSRSWPTRVTYIAYYAFLKRTYLVESLPIRCVDGVAKAAIGNLGINLKR